MQDYMRNGGMGMQTDSGGFGSRPGGGQMTPTGQGAPPQGGMSFQDAIQPGRNAGLQRAQYDMQGYQQNLQRMQMRCMQGDGQACMQVQQLQDRMGQLDARNQQQMGMAQMGGARSTGNVGGRGGSPQSMSASMVGAQYGYPSFGGSMGGGRGY